MTRRIALSALALLVACTSVRPPPPAEDVARVELVRLRLSIDSYRTDHGALPVSLESLTTLLDASREPYLARVPRDPWGGAYLYRLLAPDRYDLRSPGPDGLPGTPDDVALP